jgi:hypothetical protein
MAQEGRRALKILTKTACIGGWLCIALIAVLSLLPADDLVRTSVGGYAEHHLVARVARMGALE